jgi:hypothetical protein
VYIVKCRRPSGWKPNPAIQSKITQVLNDKPHLKANITKINQKVVDKIAKEKAEQAESSEQKPQPAQAIN